MSDPMSVLAPVLHHHFTRDLCVDTQCSGYGRDHQSVGRSRDLVVRIYETVGNHYRTFCY